MQFGNKERGLIPCSFASGKASVTIFSQPEMCTVTLSNPHNMLGVIRFASVIVHSRRRAKANVEEITFLRRRALLSLRAMHENII